MLLAVHASTAVSALWCLGVPLAALVARVLHRRYRPGRVDGRAAQLAVDNAHPSARALRYLDREQRRQVAVDVARLLAEAGLIAERETGGVAVLSRGEDGNYLVEVGQTWLTVLYGTNGGVEQLDRVLSTRRAVEVVLAHAGVPVVA